MNRTESINVSGLTKHALIAASAGGIEVMRLMMPDYVKVATSTTMEQAMHALEHQAFDIITIGVHFDGSRMFDLLSYVRGSYHRNTPVVCFRASPSIVGDMCDDATRNALAVLGAREFWDLSYFSDQESYERLQTWLWKYL